MPIVAKHLQGITSIYKSISENVHICFSKIDIRTILTQEKVINRKIVAQLHRSIYIEEKRSSYGGYFRCTWKVIPQGNTLKLH